MRQNTDKFIDMVKGNRKGFLNGQHGKIFVEWDVMGDQFPNTVWLKQITVENKGCGDGSVYLKQCMDKADLLGVSILLHPDTKRNRQWYLKLGFVEDNRWGHSMSYLPKKN